MVDSYSRLADSSAGGAGSNFSNLSPQGPLRQCIHEVPALLIRVTSRETERDLTPARAQSALWEGEKARPTHDDDLGSGKVATQEMADCAAVSAGGRGRLQTRQKRVLRDLSATTARAQDVRLRPIRQ